MPVASWMIVDGVEVKLAIHPLLQKSAVDINDRSSAESSKTWTSVCRGVSVQVPVAFEKIISTLGNPTLSPPPTFRFCKQEESEFQKKKCMCGADVMDGGLIGSYRR